MDTADRATRAELTEGKSPAEAQDVEAVLEAFAAERLLTLAADTVEISHEALLTAWPLLRDTWLAETHADRITRTRLHTTAAEWARHSRDRSYLYTGSLLAAASDTAARIGADPSRHPPLSQTERDFLHASSHAHQRTARRQQGIAALLAALVISLTATTVLAVRAGRQAAFSPGGKLAIGGADGTVRLWNPATGRRASVPPQARTRPGGVQPQRQAADRRRRHSAAVACGCPPPNRRPPTSQAVPVTSVTFSPDGEAPNGGTAQP